MKLKRRKQKMSKMKDKYFDILDKVDQKNWDRAYELSNLIEFTEWSIQSEKNDLKAYIQEFNDLVGEEVR